MTKITLDNRILFRVPQFPIDATLAERWDELKESIEISSPPFFKLVETTTAEQLCNLPEKYQHTIQKYFNRARFRATPYGTFAGFGFHNMEFNQQTNLVISSKQIAHRFRDWTDKDIIAEGIVTSLSENTKLFTNSTWYKINDCIRYVHNDSGHFHLTDIPYDEIIVQVLECCKTPISYLELNARLSENGLVADWLMELVQDMILEQLLISEHHPNVIGTDYFHRIGLPKVNTEAYVLTERKVVRGSVDRQLFKHIPALAKAVSTINGNAVASDSLNEFLQQFSKRYDLRAVPIMEALDPELGIGYGTLEKVVDTNNLIDEINQRKPSTLERQLPQHNFVRMLAEHLTFNPSGNNVLLLDDLVDDKTNKPAKLPNTFSAMVSVSDNLVQLDYFGGATANSLLGRFTLGQKEVTDACRSFAQIEMKANPDVLFFDIAYMAEGKVDNINRREHIYDYQLSILNYDTSANPLYLDDILIFIDRGELILYSKKNSKRLISRLTTAYNFNRSDLPLFRLLCDLQSQQLTANLMIDLPSILPDFNQYPRLQFKNIILSPAKWIITNTSLENNVTLQKLQVLLHDRGVTQYIKVGEGDQTLCLHMEDQADVALLLQILRKRETLLVEEFIFPKEATILDTEGKPYIGQYLLTYTHDSLVYSTKVATLQEDITLTRRFLPGSAWLYLELYCHPRQADRLLEQYIHPFFEDEQEAIVKWFFIRYNEPNDHIRLRMLLHDSTSNGIFLSKLSKQLEPEITIGRLHDIQIKTYVRELERYGTENMTAVESHFHVDSQYVLSLLQHPIGDLRKYHLCLRLLQEVFDSNVFLPLVFDKLIERLRQSFNIEQGITYTTFKSINKTFDNYKKELQPSLSSIQQVYYEAMCKSLLSILKKCNPEQREDLFSSLFHMHVNRLFSENQRSHELVIYNFMDKQLKQQMALQKAIRV